jgi:hypothetical protein
MLDHHTVLAILQLNGSQERAPMAANDLWMLEKYKLFIWGLLRGFIMFCRPDVDDNNNIFKRRCLNRFVKSKIGDDVQYDLCNLNSEVEGEVSMNSSDEE